MNRNLKRDKLPPNLHDEMFLIINEIDKNEKQKRIDILTAIRTHHVCNNIYLYIPLCNTYMYVLCHTSRCINGGKR